MLGTQVRPARRQVGAGLTQVEATAASALCGVASGVLVPFAVDLLGLPFPPWPMLAVVLAASAGAFATLRRRARRDQGTLAAWSAVVAGLGGWLLWLARPDFLPLGTGPDLTHHLLLIRYLETHWQLVHDPALERFLGEMAQYTPGSQLLAAFAGAWSGTDGTRALHGVLAATVALKAGFLFLIASRTVRQDGPRVALGLCSVWLLLAAPRYFLGAFTEYAFVAQVVAELFVVAMWWAAAAWDDAPTAPLAALFSVAGAAAFLTWPVYTGPPALAFILVIAVRRDLAIGARIRHALVAFVPFGLVALTYLAGRLGWLQMAGTGGDAPWPSVARYSALLLVLAAGGLVAGAVRRQARVTVVFAGAVLAQAAAFYVLAQRSGATQPYMALKMFYLLLWPMCALAALALGEIWHAGRLLAARLRVTPRLRVSRLAPAALIAAVVTLVSVPLLRSPRVLQPRPAAVSAPLHAAGQWARANLPPGCVDYLVADDESAYWLHLAVLGNPRMSPRTGDNATYELQEGLLRWLTPGGLPFAIADLPALPRDVREELDIVRQFDTAAVVRRRGPASCPESP